MKPNHSVKVYLCGLALMIIRVSFRVFEKVFKIKRIYSQIAMMFTNENDIVDS